MEELKNFPVEMVNGSEGLLTVASGPVIIEGGKVLLVQHGEELWKFPGGTVRTNESFEQTAVREVKEEVGAQIELRGEPHIMLMQREKDGKTVTVILVHYFARLLSDVLEKGEGIDKMEWYPIDKLPADTQPNVKPVVQHFSRLSS